MLSGSDPHCAPDLCRLVVRGVWNETATVGHKSLLCAGADLKVPSESARLRIEACRLYLMLDLIRHWASRQSRVQNFPFTSQKLESCTQTGWERQHLGHGRVTICRLLAQTGALEPCLALGFYCGRLSTGFRGQYWDLSLCFSQEGVVCSSYDIWSWSQGRSD